MILYLVYDKKNNSATAPAIAPSFEEAQRALKQIYPENIDDLVIHELIKLNSFYDLFLITLDENKPLPDFILRSDDVTPSSTLQDEVAQETSDLHHT
ncbi:hypothetical protein [Microviridae sp.]|nr:hypothetical protein [Microviridae sp.]